MGSLSLIFTQLVTASSSVMPTKAWIYNSPLAIQFNATPHSLFPPTGPCSYYSPISSPLSSLCIPISPNYVKLLYYIIVIIFYRNSKSQITLESISKGCSWFMVESRGEWVSEWISPLNNCHSAPIALIVVNRPVCSVVARGSVSHQTQTDSVLLISNLVLLLRLLLQFKLII